MFDTPSDCIVNLAGWLIKRADPDAGSTGSAVDRPESKAFFRIQRPSIQTFSIGNIDDVTGGYPGRNRLAGAIFGTLCANIAEVPHPELNGFVRHKRQIRKDFVQTNPGAELRRNQPTGP